MRGMERLTALLLAAAVPQLTERRRREGGGGAALTGRASSLSPHSLRSGGRAAGAGERFRGRAIARVSVFVYSSVMRTQVPKPMTVTATEGE